MAAAIFVYISSITCAPCKTSSDWIRALVAVTYEILKRESSKCILDPPRVRKGDPNRNPWLAKMVLTMMSYAESVVVNHVVLFCASKCDSW